MANFLVWTITISFCLVIAVQAVPLENERRLRALELFERLLGKEKRACVGKGQACDWDDRCCEGRCYYENGADLNPSNDGRCVDCIQKGQVCQYNADCCGSDMHCDSGRSYKAQGVCSPYRRSGDCYTDGQCVNGCVRSGWNLLWGQCT